MHTRRWALSAKEVGSCNSAIHSLMKAAGLFGVSRRKRVKTTIRSPDRRPAPDLVDRDFTAEGPNRLWVADITYIRTLAGFVYLAVILDVWSRRIVGWCVSGSPRKEIVLGALRMAIGQRQPIGVIHHSDQGSQYTSMAYGRSCREAGVHLSMGSEGDGYDNAMCESFFATLETELLDRRRFRTHSEADIAVFDYIEGFYSPRPRHSALGPCRRSSSKGRPRGLSMWRRAVKKMRVRPVGFHIGAEGGVLVLCGTITADRPARFTRADGAVCAVRVQKTKAKNCPRTGSTPALLCSPSRT